MSKCFITKLPSSVDNDNLPVLGQLKIKWLKQSDLTDNDARAIDLQTNDSITVKVSGAHFTDNTLASNIGNTKIITATDGVVSLYVSNDADAVLTIDNKYSLSYLGFAHNGKDMLPKQVYFDIEDIRGCTNLTNLILSSTQISGDISAVSNLVNLQNIYINGTQISGDLSKIPINAVYISQYSRNTTTNFTWTSGGRKNAKLLAIEGSVPFDTASMDNMLIDQATCTLNSSVKVISVSGTRTSASDAAVATLQNMGVTITGVTKQA